MKKRYRILVLTDHMPWGHRSIAKAIFGYLKEHEKREGFKVSYAEVKADTAGLGAFYNFAYRYNPKSNKIFHWAASKKSLRRITEEASVMNTREIEKTLKSHKPDLVISAYYLHSHCLAKLRNRMNLDFKLWTVVADPWTMLPISYVKQADLNLVYDEIGEKMAEKLGIDSSKVLKTGWWTRSQMYEKYDRNKMRKRLGFGDDRPVIFIGGGSLGTNSLTKILPALLAVKKNVGLVINTGTDKLSFNMVDEYIRLLRRLKRNEFVEIRNMGWIDNMAEVLSAVDIVFGKAGPNFLFDVVAAEKPFVAITHIGGQEDGNIDLIRRKKLGWIREKGRSAARFLLEYLENPEEYNERYRETIQEEAARNKESMKKVLNEIKRVIKKPTERVLQ